MSKVVLGTRGSALAREQTRRVEARLREVHPGIEVETRVYRTQGDRDRDHPIRDMGGVGVFVSELESALARGEIDAAVHSLKDLPANQPDELEVRAVLAREDARDALVSRDGWDLISLPEGARVATGSPRRRAMLVHQRRDLRFVEIRGNVDTRVAAVERGDFDAVVLAMAGLLRLGIRSPTAVALPLELCLPAAGQGTIAVETRIDDERTGPLVTALRDPATWDASVAERAFLRRFGGGCEAPVGVYAHLAGGGIHVEGAAFAPSGLAAVRVCERGERGRAGELGHRVADGLRVAGGRALVVAGG